MSPWKAVGSVIAGAVTTVALSTLTGILLPILGFAAAEAVGNWLPIWVFAVPLAIGVTAGGAIAGLLQGNDRKGGAILGGLAGALGVAVVGVVLGLVFLALLLGMTLGHGQEMDIPKAALAMATLGGGSGFVAGAVFGAIGGVGGSVGRRESGL